MQMNYCRKTRSDDKEFMRSYLKTDIELTLNTKIYSY